MREFTAKDDQGGVKYRAERVDGAIMRRCDAVYPLRNTLPLRQIFAFQVLQRQVRAAVGVKMPKQKARSRTLLVILLPKENGKFARVSETAAKWHASGNQAAAVAMKMGNISEIRNLAADTEDCLR